MIIVNYSIWVINYEKQNCHILVDHILHLQCVVSCIYNAADQQV